MVVVVEVVEVEVVREGENRVTAGDWGHRMLQVKQSSVFTVPRLQPREPMLAGGGRRRCLQRRRHVCSGVCSHTNTVHTDVDAHGHTHVHTHTHADTYKHARTHTTMHTHACILASTPCSLLMAQITPRVVYYSMCHMCANVCVCVCVCVCVRMCTCGGGCEQGDRGL